MLEAGGDGGFSLDVFKVLKEEDFMSKDVFCWRWVVMEVFHWMFLRLSRRMSSCQRTFYVEAVGDGGFLLDVFKVVEEDDLLSKNILCRRRVVMEVFQ